MTSPAKTRRENQPIPTTADAAAARFKCEAYLCTMDGAKCRDQHVHAAEFKPANRDACIDCPAGEARAILLGKGAGGSGQAAICTARTAKGGPCSHAPVEGGLCHIHRGAYAKKERKLKKTPQAPVKVAQRPAAPAQTAPARVPASAVPPVEAHRITVEKMESAPPKPPAPAPVSVVEKKPVAVKVAKPSPGTDAKVEALCAREGCDRPAYSGARLSEYCKGCGASAYSTLRKLDQTSTPSDDARRAWLRATPVQPQFRHPRKPSELVKAPAPPPGKFAAKGIDWDKVDLGKRSDCEIAREFGVSATAVRFQRRKRKIAAPVTPRPKVVRKVRKALGQAIVSAATATAEVPVFEVAAVPVDVHVEVVVDQVDEPQRIENHEVIQAAPAVEPVEPPVPIAPIFIPDSDTPAESLCSDADTPEAPAPADTTDHLVAVTFALNRRAFAELERMAQAGLHGDDPCDAARTLVLDGLRRFSLVRP